MISNECICIAAMLFAGGLTALWLYYNVIEPKISRQLGESYVNMRKYRPDDTYRHQYWWKRPFLRYPYPFRRPFDYWRPVYYEQQPLEAKSISEYEQDPDTGSCKIIPSLERGTARIPVPRLGSAWTIAFDMRFYPAMTQDDKLIFRLGQGSPSPMMVYSPIDNTLTMILYTHFDGYTERVINLHDMDTGQWNNIIWVQNGRWMTVYINGEQKLRVNVGSLPKTSPGTFYLDAKAFVQYKNVQVCNSPWNSERVKLYLEGNRV